jgi:4-hydroxy-tetrahydrodipicolinate synthase
MKAAANKFRGVFAFIVTPTNNDGEAVDEGRLRGAIDYQIAHGVHGLTVFGSTGGMGSFSERERQRVIEVAAKHIDGRVRFLPGTGSITTAQAVRLSQFAEAAGADGVLVVPINYWKPTDNELYGHYEAIAKAVKIPLGIYNNPGTTGVDIKPALVARIAKIDNVGFIKESSGDMSRISAIRQLTGYQISVLNGNDACTPEAIAAGVEGWFAGSANFMPERCVELFRLGYEKKDIDAMREFFQPLFPLCDRCACWSLRTVQCLRGCSKRRA